VRARAGFSFGWRVGPARADLVHRRRRQVSDPAMANALLL